MPDTDPVIKFFTADLPLKIAGELHGLLAVEGRIAFSITAAGKWTLRFSNPEPVVAEFDEDAELRLWFSRVAFEQFLANTLDVSAAVATGDVRARGDVKLLNAFASLLTGGGSALGWDAG